MNDAILQVEGLKTYFYLEGTEARVVDNVSFSVARGRTLALVGESGCGKSMTALSILRLVPSPPGRIVGGRVLFEGKDLLGYTEPQMRALRGNALSMIFQEPMTSLNPVFRVGRQIGDVIVQHRRVSKAEARKQAITLLDQVGIPAPGERVDDYPHQLSGGMRQRVMIAMALACDPELLIADEPTTALDVTIQAQILELLREIQAQRGLGILLITHDLGIVAENADEVAVMYAGQIVEHAPVDSLFEKPSHPYTLGLFNSLPSLNSRGERLKPIQGQVPAATAFPEGCRFRTRCPYADVHGSCEQPPLIEVAPGHRVACWLHDKDLMAARGKPTGIPAIEETAR